MSVKKRVKQKSLSPLLMLPEAERLWHGDASGFWRNRSAFIAGHQEQIISGVLYVHKGVIELLRITNTFARFSTELWPNFFGRVTENCRTVAVEREDNL